MGRYREYFALTGDRRCSNAGLPEDLFQGFLHTGKYILPYTPGKMEAYGAEIQGFSQERHGKGSILQTGERTAAAGSAGRSGFFRAGRGRGFPPGLVPRARAAHVSGGYVLSRCFFQSGSRIVAMDTSRNAGPTGMNFAPQ